MLALRHWTKEVVTPGVSVLVYPCVILGHSCVLVLDTLESPLALRYGDLSVLNTQSLKVRGLDG